MEFDVIDFNLALEQKSIENASEGIPTKLGVFGSMNLTPSRRTRRAD